MADHDSPFQGLGFYTEDDAKRFFGRTTERKIILAHLRTARLTLLYAESGVGKSSLLRAGVAARLHELAARTNGASRSPRFVPVVFSAWKDDPVADLISELERQVRATTSDADGSTARAVASGTGLADAITTAAAALDATLVIILDQFEEHFSYRRVATDPDRLADELAACVNSGDVPANFLIAVREDAYGGLGDLFSGRISNVYNNYLHLEYLSRDAAREAIEKPVELYNAEHRAAEAITLEADLTDAVLDEVRRGNLQLGARRWDRDGDGGSVTSDADEIETPFLQLVMTRLWECERAHRSRVLRRSTLEGELGGAETIVRNHVGRALDGLAGQELDAATDIFRDLVTPSGAKVAHTAGDLAQMTSHSEDTVVSVLDRLYEERIVRSVDPAPGTTDARYEIFHDRLAAPILDWRDQQENARLERAKQRAEREAQTQRAHAQRFKRQARIMLGLAVGLLIALIAGIVLLAYARDQSASARKERRAAVSNTARARYFGLTTRAQSQLAGRRDIALLLYLAAYDQSPQRVAERNLVATLQAVQRSRGVGILHGHNAAVNGIAFSPVGNTLASASGDKTVRLWTVTRAGHAPLGRPLQANGPLFSAAFDPHGQILASGSFNKIILWNIARHAEQAAIPYSSGAVTTVAFSARGNLLAAGGSDGTVLIWNAVTHTQRRLTVSPGTPVRSVAFSPDGNVLATSSHDTVTSQDSVVLWNVGVGTKLGQPLTGPTGPIYSVAFSPDGRTIAAGGQSGAIVLWDRATRGQTGTLVGLKLVYSIAFSPHGRSLAAGGTGATIIWNLPAHRGRGRRLTRHQGGVYTVAFSPDGKLLASAGSDRTISLWDSPIGAHFGPIVRHTNGTTHVAISPSGLVLATGGGDGLIHLSGLSGRSTGTPRPPLDAHAGPIGDIAFDPTGRVLAAGYGDGTIRFWNVTDGSQVGAPLRGHDGPVFSIAFDRTGARLVSGGRDGTVRLWDVPTHKALGRPLGHDFGAVYAVAFSPNGREIASGGDGRAIRLWNAQTQRPLVPALIAQDNDVFSLAFSPDGRLLASGGADDTIHLWDAAAPVPVAVRTLSGDSNLIRSLAFSPDGQTLASGSTDATVRLWDVATGTQLGGPLTGHTQAVESVAFGPGGRLLVSGSKDNTVRLWQGVALPSSFATLRDRVCSYLGAGLSPAEWSEYAPGIPYQQTCPRTTPS